MYTCLIRKVYLERSVRKRVVDNPLKQDIKQNRVSLFHDFTHPWWITVHKTFGRNKCLSWDKYTYVFLINQANCGKLQKKHNICSVFVFMKKNFLVVIFFFCHKFWWNSGTFFFRPDILLLQYEGYSSFYYPQINVYPIMI